MIKEEHLIALAINFDNWCINEGLLDDDMADAVGRFSEAAELTEEETEALLEVR